MSYSIYMPNANKFLPLIEQRNKKRNIFITKINDSLLRDLSSATIKNYHASFEEKNQQFQKFMLSKDNETVSLAKKYLQRFEQKKKILRKMACLKNMSQKDQSQQKPNKDESSHQNDQKERQKLLKIQALIKQLSLVRKQPKSPVTVDKENSTIAHIPTEEMRRMKSILLSNERRKSLLKSKQDLIEKYGCLKNKVSNSLQNDIKVKKYKSGIYNKQDSARIYRKLLTQQYTVSLVAKNPQNSYKYDNYDDEDNHIMKTLEQTKYRYFQTQKRSKINLVKSSKVKSQNRSKKNISYRLDTFEPWDDNTESVKIQ